MLFIINAFENNNNNDNNNKHTVIKNCHFLYSNINMNTLLALMRS